MQPVKGIALKLCSVLLFIIMSSLIKATAPHVPPGQAVFFRSFFAIPVIFAYYRALVWDYHSTIAHEFPRVTLAWVIPVEKTLKFSAI